MNQIRNIRTWKKKKPIRVYTQIEDPPIPFLPLLSPIILFIMYYGMDGSLYTEHNAAISGATYERFENGHKVLTQEVPAEVISKAKTSIHGSGEVVGFERAVENWPRAHLGFALRDINKPRLLAEQHIGTAGHYIGKFEKSPPPTRYSVIAPELFETVDAPVFSIWASPETTNPPKGSIITATTKTLDNGIKLTFSIVLTLMKVDQRPGDHRQVVFTYK